MAIREDDNRPNRRFGIINLVLIGFGVLLLLSSFIPNQGMQQVPRVPYSLFIDQVNDGAVKRAFITQDQIRYELSEVEEGAPSVLATTPIFDMDLPQRLESKGVEFAAAPPKKPNIFTTILSWVVPPLIFILVLQFFARRSMGGGGAQGALNFTKSKAKVYVPDEQSRVTFADVAGVDEAKDELNEIVDFLKTPERYTEIGARIPKGVLLVGPPGTGKTLLSKAVAGEAGVPFFIISGSEFVELFVGAGAARVRDLFEQAKKNAPCIIFIDELDAIGKSRSGSMGVVGGNDEREQTLNQLLTEMDGFEGNTGIIVVAATNRVDILDSALLRPGRFDRQITVNLPDVKGRLSILKVHARNKKFNKDVSLNKIAQRTPGFSGADLANLLNEASILAARQKTTEITSNDISISVDRILTGLEGNCLKDSRSKRLVAYQEIGKGLTGTMLSDHDPVEKITLIPRGNRTGLTWFTPEEDQGLISRGQILARIIGTLGARAAEEIIFGEAEVTTGASADIMQVTSMARQMVTRYGMSPVGPIAFEDATNNQVFLDGTQTSGNTMTLDTTSKIDNEVQEIVNYCYQQARAILSENRVAMDRLVDILIEEETIEGPKFREILAEYTEVPERKKYESYFTKG